MPRTGVTREQVHQAAADIATEGANPTVHAVRKRLGGGSPNRITPWLAEWREAQTPPQVDALPEIPQAIDNAMRHLWALAWQQARAQLATERQALNGAQKAVETEREAVLAETRELKALAEERQSRLQEQGVELQRLRLERDEALARATRSEALLEPLRADLEQAREAVLHYRKQSNGLPAECDRLREQVARLQAEASREHETARQAKQTLDLGGKKISALEHTLSEERQARQQAEQQLAELRIELATLRERASQQEQLTQLIETFRGQQVPIEHSNP